MDKFKMSRLKSICLSG